MNFKWNGTTIASANSRRRYCNVTTYSVRDSTTWHRWFYSKAISSWAATSLTEIDTVSYLIAGVQRLDTFCAENRNRNHVVARLRNLLTHTLQRNETFPRIMVDAWLQEMRLNAGFEHRSHRHPSIRSSAAWFLAPWVWRARILFLGRARSTKPSIPPGSVNW